MLASHHLHDYALEPAMCQRLVRRLALWGNDGRPDILLTGCELSSKGHEKLTLFQLRRSFGNPMDLIEIEKLVSPDFDLSGERDRVLSADEIRELHRIFLQMQERYDNSPNKQIGAQPIEKATQYGIWMAFPHQYGHFR
jgi:hypothetical protein